MDSSRQSFFARNDFLIRRLHSLSGLIPVGAYMVVHLLVNASIINGDTTFLNNVLKIHSLPLLTVVEWTFIFIPLIFHAVVGVWIVAEGLPNPHQYPLGANYRYTLQRATGIIAFFFIMLHVFHMHGWFHNSLWVNAVVNPLGGGQFKPYNATSTAGLALQSTVMVAIYIIGVLASIFHLANGIWTMGITWGVWTSERAQRRALRVCAGVGLLLTVVSGAALFGLRGAVDTPEKLQEVRKRERIIIETKTATGEIEANEHKMYHPPATGEAAAARSN